MPIRKSRFRTTTRTVEIARDDEKSGWLDMIGHVAVQPGNHVDTQAEDQSDTDHEDPACVKHPRRDHLNAGKNHIAGHVNKDRPHDRVGHRGKEGREFG